jgi:hypothetical protein
VLNGKDLRYSVKVELTSAFSGYFFCQGLKVPLHRGAQEQARQKERKKMKERK